MILKYFLKYKIQKLKANKHISVKKNPKYYHFYPKVTEQKTEHSIKNFWINLKVREKNYQSQRLKMIWCNKLNSIINASYKCQNFITNQSVLSAINCMKLKQHLQAATLQHIYLPIHIFKKKNDELSKFWHKIENKRPCCHSVCYSHLEVSVFPRLYACLPMSLADRSS